MGILDEAIREHLDLKRRHGAEESEVKQLEDEAFGPHTRPGEPDFPERPAEGTLEAADVAPLEGFEAVAPAEDATTVMPGGAPPATGEVAPEAPEAPLDPAETSAPELTDSPPPEAEAPILAPSEPELPAVEEVDPGEVEARTPEPEPETGFYDRAAEVELESEELELELQEDRDEDFEEAELEGEAPPATDPPPLGGQGVTEPPIESLETVEHHIEEAPSEEVPLEEAPSEELPLEEPLEGEEEDEGDVLEETPEFLRDQPEDDELWFEQGEPKDFDF